MLLSSSELPGPTMLTCDTPATTRVISLFCCNLFLPLLGNLFLPLLDVLLLPLLGVLLLRPTQTLSDADDHFQLAGVYMEASDAAVKFSFSTFLVALLNIARGTTDPGNRV